LAEVTGPVGPLRVAVVLDQIRSAYNVGSFFRTADAAGVEKLYLCGITPRADNSQVAKTALGAHLTVRWEWHYDTLVPLRALAARGYQIAAVETGADSMDLFGYAPNWPVAVVFGNEVTGLSPEVLEACHVRIAIPMRGRKGSLNVATAGGVVLYDLLRRTY
jgi:tRNA G18 (ribose-2'-O)-methylase SpoU